MPAPQRPTQQEQPDGAIRSAPSRAGGPHLRRALRLAWARLGWGEFVALAAMLTCGAGFYGFATIVDEAFEGEAHHLDESILKALRNPADLADPIGPHWLEIVMRDVTALGGYPVVIMTGLVTLGYLLIIRRRRTALLVLLSLSGAIALNGILKQSFHRPRPDLVAHLVEVQSASFPSGHAMLSAATYLTLAGLLARVQRRRRVKAYILAVAIALTLLIGLSRIYLGVHWPSDVAAGWCVGAAWAMAWWLVARLLQSRRSRAAAATGDQDARGVAAGGA